MGINGKQLLLKQINSMKNQKNIQAALALLALSLNQSFVTPTRADTFTNTGSMSVGHTYAPAILLTNGDVLVVGGYNTNTVPSAELYNPVTGRWTNTGSPITPRLSPLAALLLRDGKVLVAGGETSPNSYTGISSAELYDPVTGNWTLTGSMNAAVYTYNQVATLLPNGKVLVMGGQGTNGYSTISGAELYDPATGVWTPTRSMNYARVYHTSTLLRTGKVLVAGGYNGTTLNNTAELYDPNTELWTLTGTNSVAFINATATLLPNGKVLVAGGHTSPTGYSATSAAELYDPATGLWTQTSNSMYTARYAHTATLLADGKVLVTGGSDSSGNSLSSAELFDPATGLWTTNGVMNVARRFHSATLLTEGNVLIAGGGFPGLTNAELYTSAAYQITNQPQSQFGYWGESASFSVSVASGCPPLTYQWLQNGLAISGATNSMLTLNDLQSTNAGIYTVVITDAGGNVLTSQPATLGVNAAAISMSLYTGVTITGVVGQTYGIQTTANLANSNSWVGVDNLTLTVPTELWYDSRPATQAKCFYRVVSGPISIP